MSDAVREPRRWSFWFVASLCLNFFLIGVIVMGLVVARNRSIAAAVSGGGGAMRPEIVLQLLPRSGAIKMCGMLGERMPDFRRLGREVVDARRAMFKIFRTEPFDQAAFREAMARIAAAEIAVVREREATATAIVLRLTPDERKHFTRQVVRRFFALRKEPALRHEQGALAAICKELGAGAGGLPQ